MTIPGHSFQIRLYPDVLRSINSTTFTGAFQAVGSKLSFNPSVIKFLNGSNTTVTISWDGTTSHEILLASSVLTIDCATNGGIIPIGTQFYVSGAASTGLFYISVYYRS